MCTLVCVVVCAHTLAEQWLYSGVFLINLTLWDKIFHLVQSSLVNYTGDQ